MTKTVSEKIAQGTLQKCRVKHTICFEPLNHVPDIPDHLTPEGAEFFIYVCELLLSNGTLTSGNIPDITLASIWWGVAREAEKMVQQEGIVQTFSTGATNVSPYLSTLDRATTQIQRFSDRYGMSLLSRSKVPMPDTKKDDPFEKL